MSGLIADIGGTNVRFALVDDSASIVEVKRLRCADYPDAGRRLRGLSARGRLSRSVRGTPHSRSHRRWSATR